jgi:hypothetical protein
MVQGFYTLAEAAQMLGMAPEELKQMAQKNQIRSFQDRGTWRFRVQDIQELARLRGASSDQELVLGEAPPIKKGDSSKPKSGPRAGSHGPDVFDFSLETDERAKRKPDSKRGAPPTPKPGSDSDVRIVADSGDVEFVFEPDKVSKHGSDSDVKLVPSDSDARRRADTPPASRGKKPESPVPRKTRGEDQPDSPVRLSPADSDSDIKIVGTGSDEVPLGDSGELAASDSDIRLEGRMATPPASDEGILTEEIDLDAELKKKEAEQKKSSKLKPKSKLPKFTQTSPFELSDIHKKGEKVEKSEAPSKPGKKPDSSDYDLTPGKPDSSDFDLNVGQESSSEFDLELDSGVNVQGLKDSSSGINIGHPADAGISLEQGDDSSLEFELAPDSKAGTPRPATPKPATPKPGKKSADEKPDSSEFELSLDDSQSSPLELESDSSEFELTLDDSGGLEGAPKSKAGKGSSEDKDIFESDFEVPALEDESSSQVAALETDLDSSDFDLTLGDSEVVADESGSQVVALDEEEADEAAATVTAKGRPGAELEEEVELDELAEVPEEEAEVEEEEAVGAVREVVRERLIRPAPWGVLPVILMLPCVIVMFLVLLMGLELVQSAVGYQPPGFLTKTFMGLIGGK